MPAPLLITGSTLLRSADASLQHNTFVAIEDGRIAAVGSMEDCPVPGGREVLDAAGTLVMPGLVNGHNHCAMTLFRGLADDLDLGRWLHEHIFPAEAAHVNPEMVYWCTKLAAAEMLLSGTTTVADGYFFSDQAARALSDAGMRAVVAHGIVDFPAPSVPDPSKNIDTVAAFLDRWHNREPRITPAVFAHAPYTCSPTTLKRAKKLADERGVRFFIHVAESRGEYDLIIEPQGSTPLEHLHALGILDENCVCVHAVWLGDSDLEVLAASGASVVTCPHSNFKLASGIARVQEMLDRSVRVGLGTDGCASNNNFDMFKEMDLLAKGQKAQSGRATALNARDALACATSAGSRVIGLDRLGSIEVGMRADLVLLERGRAHLTPMYNQDVLVYAACGADVNSVVVDGAVVVRDGRLLSFDVAEACCEVRNRAKALGSLDL